MKPEFEVAARALVAERIHYFAQRNLDKQVMIDPKAFAIRMPFTIDQLIAQLRTYVWAEKIQEQEITVHFRYPRSWWQFLKAQVKRWALDHSPRWMPNRLRWRLQQLVVMTTLQKTVVVFNHFLKYPEFYPSADVEDRVVRFGAAVPEIRIGGSWATDLYAPSWWEEES